MIYVINKFEKNPYPWCIEVDVTSKGSFKDLSPFYLGPIMWNDPITKSTRVCLRFENLWQYSKVYKQHQQLGPDFDAWQKNGFESNRAHRYPMGKGAKPLYSLWMGQKLDYIEARKKLYIPQYADLVIRTKSYALLYKWVVEGKDIVLRDFDGYNYKGVGITLKEIVRNHRRPLGHAFVIKALLTGGIDQML